MNKVNAPLIGGVIAGVVVGFMGIITCVFWLWKSGREWARIQREAVDEGYVASSHGGSEDKVMAVMETGFSDSELELGDDYTGVQEDDGLERTPTSTIITMSNEVVVGTVGNEMADSATRVSSWTADASGELSSTSADTESVTYQRSVGS